MFTNSSRPALQALVRFNKEVFGTTPQQELTMPEFYLRAKKIKYTPLFMKKFSQGHVVPVFIQTIKESIVDKDLFVSSVRTMYMLTKVYGGYDSWSTVKCDLHHHIFALGANNISFDHIFKCVDEVIFIHYFVRNGNCGSLVDIIDCVLGYFNECLSWCGGPMFSANTIKILNVEGYAGTTFPSIHYIYRNVTLYDILQASMRLKQKQGTITR